MKPLVSVLGAVGRLASSGVVWVLLVFGLAGSGCDSNPTPHPGRDARTPDSGGGMEPGRGTDGAGEYDPDNDFSNGADATSPSPDEDNQAADADGADHAADAADGAVDEDARGPADGAAGGDAWDPANGAVDAGPCPSQPESGVDQVESHRRARGWWADRD